MQNRQDVRFSSQQELAKFLKSLNVDYEKYADKLWKEGRVTQISQLADASVESLTALGILHVHADDIKAHAGSIVASVTPVSGQDAQEALAAEIKSLKRKLQDVCGAVADQGRQLASMQHSTTDHAQIGQTVKQAADYDPGSSHFPKEPAPVPELIDKKFKRKWRSASNEEDLQVLAVQAITALLQQGDRLADGSRESSDDNTVFLLDTHCGGYTNPTAKIGMTLSDTAQARWCTLIAPIELKLTLADESSQDSVTGQLAQRWDQLRQGGQPNRGWMLGLAWSQDYVMVWRFSGGQGPRAYTTTGAVPFSWHKRNGGFQLLVGFLLQDMGRFGYTRFTCPLDCGIRTDKGTMKLARFELLARTAQADRLVFTARGSGGPLAKAQTVVVKVGHEEQIRHEYDLLNNRQEEKALPRAWGMGKLPAPVQGMQWCYVSGPYGQHLETQPSEVVIEAVASVAEALGRLAAGVAGKSALTHRDISPSNLIYHPPEKRVYLLDLHVAHSDSRGGPSGASSTGAGSAGHLVVAGKQRYLALRLSLPNPVQTLTTDLESLFYSFMDIASAGAALRWRRTLKQDVAMIKFATLFFTPAWERALSKCAEPYRAPLKRLHVLLFGRSYAEYLAKSTVSADEFAAAVRGTKKRKRGTGRRS